MTRVYLLRRRLYWTRRMRHEFRWPWGACWHTAGVNQQVALELTAEIAAADAERLSFEADVLADIAALDEVFA